MSHANATTIRHGDGGEVCEACGESVPHGATQCTGCKAPVALAAHIMPSPQKQGLTVKDLDNAVQTVRRLKVDASLNCWDLGKTLADVHERQLWKLRTDDRGVALFKSFDRWCIREVNITSKWAKELIKVAEHYRREQIARLGPTKCSVLLQLPAGKARDDAEAAAQSQSVSQLKAAVGQHPNKLTKIAPPKSPGRPRKSDDTDTHISIVGRVQRKKTTAFFFSPENKGDKAVRATCGKVVRDWVINMEPFAYFDFDSDVRLTMALVTNTSGELNVKLKFGRLSDGLEEVVE